MSDDDTLAADSAPPAAQTLSLDVGSLFAERYRVEAVLGRGAMGAVYRVFDEKLGERVALKLLTLEGDDAQARFVDEVRLARRVTHPNVARTHDVGDAGGARFLTMEYVEGVALDRLLAEEGPLSAARVVSIGIAVADGLGAAHAAGIVHRDLKPANVMLTGDRVVITDFGIARAVDDGAAKQTLSLAGTPMYMAPEQVSGDPVDARTDIYALGVMLFELLTQSVPFTGETPIAVALARLDRAPPDPRERASVPDPLGALVLDCMARSKEQRPASADAVSRALQSMRADASIPAAVATATHFAPMGNSGTTVAVLPFVYRGSAEHDYLGDGLAEELIDALSHNGGLRVLAMGTTARFTDNRDPRAIGRDLGADVVVDGAVQLAGSRLRLTARLVETADARQRWSERFDGALEDAFALQESLGRRVAEALRVELSATTTGSPSRAKRSSSTCARADCFEPTS